MKDSNNGVLALLLLFWHRLIDGDYRWADNRLFQPFATSDNACRWLSSLAVVRVARHNDNSQQYSTQLVMLSNALQD
ncbi:MAG: hypothetical protein ACSLEM_02425 [Candidatus Malihini olakiniferum]